MNHKKTKKTAADLTKLWSKLHINPLNAIKNVTNENCHLTKLAVSKNCHRSRSLNNWNKKFNLQIYFVWKRFKHTMDYMNLAANSLSFPVLHTKCSKRLDWIKCKCYVMKIIWKFIFFFGIFAVLLSFLVFCPIKKYLGWVIVCHWQHLFRKHGFGAVNWGS